MQPLPTVVVWPKKQPLRRPKKQPLPTVAVWQCGIFSLCTLVGRRSNLKRPRCHKRVLVAPGLKLAWPTVAVGNANRCESQISESEEQSLEKRA